MRGRSRPTPLTPEQRAVVGLPAETPRGQAESPRGDEPRKAAPTITPLRDVEAPVDQAAYQKLLLRGIARALECATSAKEMTEAVKVGTDLYEALYGGGPREGGLGSKLVHEGNGYERGNG